MVVLLSALVWLLLLIKTWGARVARSFGGGIRRTSGTKSIIRERGTVNFLQRRKKREHKLVEIRLALVVERNCQGPAQDL
jgi:hypothetical protein